VGCELNQAIVNGACVTCAPDSAPNADGTACEVCGPGSTPTPDNSACQRCVGNTVANVAARRVHHHGQHCLCCGKATTCSLGAGRGLARFCPVSTWVSVPAPLPAPPLRGLGWRRYPHTFVPYTAILSCHTSNRALTSDRSATGLKARPPLPWQDLCAGVTCTSPPNTLCYPFTGTCTNGVCSYTSFRDDTVCPFGEFIGGSYDGTCRGGECLVSPEGGLTGWLHAGALEGGGWQVG
jgi:hypothetical protein